MNDNEKRTAEDLSSPAPLRRRPVRSLPKKPDGERKGSENSVFSGDEDLIYSKSKKRAPALEAGSELFFVPLKKAEPEETALPEEKAEPEEMTEETALPEEKAEPEEMTEETALPEEKAEPEEMPEETALPEEKAEPEEMPEETALPEEKAEPEEMPEETALPEEKAEPEEMPEETALPEEKAEPEEMPEESAVLPAGEDGAGNAEEETGGAAGEDEKKESVPLYLSAFDWLKTFLFSLIAVLFLFTLVFRGVTVNGNSMNDTLQDGNYLFVSDLFYTPKTGDIVVVQSETYMDGKESLIKRVIATGGQTVRIDFSEWKVWVDGELLEEDYVRRINGQIMNSESMEVRGGIAEITVEEGHLFVMGDNRNDSLDSRSDQVGQIDEKNVMGRVILRVYPFNEFGGVD